MKSVRRRTKVSNPGAYRHYADVQSLTKTSRGRLDYTQAGKHEIYIYVSITPMSGHQKLIADQLKQKISHVLRTPYRSDWQSELVSNRNIVVDSRTFHIKTALNTDEMNREIEIYCEEKV